MHHIRRPGTTISKPIDLHLDLADPPGWAVAYALSEFARGAKVCQIERELVTRGLGRRAADKAVERALNLRVGLANTLREERERDETQSGTALATGAVLSLFLALPLILVVDHWGFRIFVGTFAIVWGAAFAALRHVYSRGQVGLDECVPPLAASGRGETASGDMRLY